MMTQEQFTNDAVELLKKLIATPSVSRNEKDAADIMEQTIRSYGFEPQREANNIWVIDPHFDESKPTLLLNAHIDTVKPVDSWQRHPLCSYHRRRPSLWFGQQRLRRRTMLTTTDIQNAYREATEL